MRDYRTIWYMNQMVHTEIRSSASPDTIFRLLANTTGWQRWTRHDASELVTPAPGDEPEGVGAVRRFRVGRIVSTEQVVVFDRPHHLGYVLLSGLPIRDYRADVKLARVDAATMIVWHATFRPKYPGSGAINRRLLSRFIKDTALRLAREAERVESTQ
jgi:hypothetical protein